MNFTQNFLKFIAVILLGLAYYEPLIADDDKDDLHTVRIVIPKVALLDIESENLNNITLKMIAPDEAGNTLSGATNDQIWLNVTSVVEIGNSRNITVRLNKQVEGINLKVLSEPYSGQGYGSWGTPQPMVTLNSADQVLISGIKSGETSIGAHHGYNLKYVAQSNDANFGKITNNDIDIVVTYTLTH